MYTVEKDDRFHYHFDFWEISKESTEKKKYLKAYLYTFHKGHANACPQLYIAVSIIVKWLFDLSGNTQKDLAHMISFTAGRMREVKFAPIH